jgi:hypothetical protein
LVNKWDSWAFKTFSNLSFLIELGVCWNAFSLNNLGHTLWCTMVLIMVELIDFFSISLSWFMNSCNGFSSCFFNYTCHEIDSTIKSIKSIKKKNTTKKYQVIWTHKCSRLFFIFHIKKKPLLWLILRLSKNISNTYTGFL